jgi:hypothetical protein
VEVGPPELCDHAIGRALARAFRRARQGASAALRKTALANSKIATQSFVKGLPTNHNGLIQIAKKANKIKLFGKVRD